MQREPGFVLSRQSLHAHLSQHRLFRWVPKNDLEQMVVAARREKVAVRTKLFTTGEAGNTLYVVLSGWIKLSHEGPKDRSFLLEVAGKGTVFGEVAVLAGQPRTADATALVETQLLAIEGRALVAALRPHPDALIEVIRMLAERLVRANTQTEDSLFLGADTRLARALMRLAALKGTSAQQTLQIDLGLSQKEMGEMSGLSRESTNKQLALWREAGLVAMKGHTLSLLDLDGLAEIAQKAPA